MNKVSTPAGFEKWMADIEVGIGYFDTWKGFLDAIYKDLVDIFSDSQGTATSLLQQLTKIRELVRQYLTSTSGKAQVSSLFRRSTSRSSSRSSPWSTNLIGFLAKISIPLMTTITTAFTDIVGALNQLMSIKTAPHWRDHVPTSSPSGSWSSRCRRSPW